MDGLPDNFVPSAFAGSMMASSGATPSQRTLKAAIDCVGIGVHTGRRVGLTLRPAAIDTGIVFRRVDLGVDIPARFDHVSETRLCTVLSSDADRAVRVGTVEHIMAALAGVGIDNAVIEVDGPEVPIFDGSATPFVFLIDCAGIVEQDAPRAVIEVLQPVRCEQGEAFVELRPAGSGVDGLDMAVSIAFAAPAIGRQALSLRLTEGSFRRDLAHARTFALASEIASLREAGLARGGSLDNAVVVDEARVLNPGGLRIPDEFVRHKLLDAVGDLALAGAPLRGRFIGHRSGHALNNRVLHTLFATPGAWRWTDTGRLGAAVAAQAA